MKQVAKLVMIDKSGNYLLMYRSNHPAFGYDPDLPGGTVEQGELVSDALVREVYEEIGVSIDSASCKKVYSGNHYSGHGTQYALFIATLTNRPDIVMSWEHSAYEWIPRDDFLSKAKNGNDTYMHMVADVVGKTCTHNQQQ